MQLTRIPFGASGRFWPAAATLAERLKPMQGFPGCGDFHAHYDGASVTGSHNLIQRQWPVWQRAAAELTAPMAAPMANQWALRFRRSQMGPPFAAVTAASRSRVRARTLAASSEAFCLAAVSWSWQARQSWT
jgi:hypothetical protein